VRICRTWRRIVFVSQRALHLRLFCTHGTPVLKTLGYWPALPIVVEYGGSLALDPPAPEDEDNVMAALKQSDRVSSISLTVTSSLLEKLSAIERQFSELEHLVLFSRDSVRLTLRSDFRWGPHLRCLHLTRIAFPSLLQLLYSSRNIVDLQLHGVLNPSRFSPEALKNALSGMAQLRSLSLHFLSTTNYHLSPSLPSGERVVLPVLTRIKLREISTKYLKGLMARIDAPRLGGFEVPFFNETIEHPRISVFINRTKMHQSHRQAYIRSSERAISISLIHPRAPTRLKLQLLCQPLSEQIFFMTRVCIHFSTFVFNVEDLRISATRPSGQGEVPYSGWLDLLGLFTGLKWFHLDGNHSTNIVRSFQLLGRQRETVLPALHKLYILQPWPLHAPLKEAVVSFMTTRGLSGHPILVEYERLSHTSELRGTGKNVCPVSPPLLANSFGVGPFSQQVIMEVLSDDILLNIFHHYLDATPRFWPTLAWVCQRWRQIVFTSPLGLNLRLHCTYGTPVLKTLDCWPALPIIVQYGGFPHLDPPAPEDDDNIIAALKQSGRVSSIGLTVTSSLLGTLSAISDPFSELEELALLSQENMQLTLPSTFRWGPRLHTLHLTRIPTSAASFSSYRFRRSSAP